jgi:hypothetical protein
VNPNNHGDRRDAARALPNAVPTPPHARATHTTHSQQASTGTHCRRPRRCVPSPCPRPVSPALEKAIACPLLPVPGSVYIARRAQCGEHGGVGGRALTLVGMTTECCLLRRKARGFERARPTEPPRSYCISRVPNPNFCCFWVHIRWGVAVFQVAEKPNTQVPPLRRTQRPKWRRSPSERCSTSAARRAARCCPRCESPNPRRRRWRRRRQRRCYRSSGETRKPTKEWRSS